MDVEIASITQLTDSVQLAEQPKLPSSQLENDSDAGMNLDGDNDDLDEIDTHTRIVVGDKWSPGSEHEPEALATGDEAVLASRNTRSPPTSTLASDSHVLHAIFESLESHDDDAEDSEWLDDVSVRADTQSVIAGDSEEEYDGETGEDDDEMLSGDEVILQGGVSDVVKVD